MAENLTTALIVRPDRAMWTSLRQRKGEWVVDEQVDAPLELPPEVTDLSDPMAVAAVKSRCGRVKGRVTTALQTHRVLLRVADLPSIDPDEIRGMAELQVDKIAPFPMDQMVVTHEVLARREDSCRVLIAAVHRDVINAIGDICFKTGLYPHAVDLQIMGWWTMLRGRELIPGAGRHLLVLADQRVADLIVIQDGLPLLIRSLWAADASGGSAPDAVEIAEELKYTLTTLEAEWGVAPVDSSTLWHSPDLGTDFVESLAAAFGAGFQARSMAELPVLTEAIARRAVERSVDTLDLAPRDWKDAMQSRRSRRRLYGIGGSVAAVWLLVIGGVLVAAQLREGKFRGTNTRITGKERRSKEAESVRSQVEALERYANRSHSALECLRETCVALAPGLELSSYRYEKFKSVTLVGYGPSYEPIGQFQNSLNAAGLFKGIESAETKTDRDKQKFTVTAKLPPDPAAKEQKAP